MNFLQNAIWYKNCQPIAIIDDGVIVEKNGKIRLIIDNKSVDICNINIGTLQRIEERLPCLRRLFRREIRCSCLVDDANVLFFRCGLLYNLNYETNTLHSIWKVPTGYSTPLNILACKDGKYRAFFGDYFDNHDRLEVNIYGVTDSGNVEVVFSFPKKTIRHIHNIISDGSTGYYIFAGDDDADAGIYHSDSSFRKVTPIYIGDKQARAVVGFVLNNGILFATDSVCERNHIYYLEKKELEWKKKVVAEINGSCINGARFKDGFVFSTTVEPPESDGSLRSLISTDLGEGILSDYVELVAVYDDLSVELVGKIKKDNLPYKLFQYGTIRFISNTNDVLCMYPTGVRKYDGKLGLLRNVNEYFDVNE